ncbi:hypothetical protein FHS57_001054 [Runella defluvii]|uniref:Uncharacterized protein n=1 Tax=Runella defluvii TaxID=370973 RepID=A0A7W6ENZ7_9BACT|nr:hypothetical protein [Runella defluvii]
MISLIDPLLDVTYFNSLIIKKDNPYKEAITTAFQDLMGDFDENK